MRNAATFTPVAILGIGCLLVGGVREQKKMAPRAHMKDIVVTMPGFVSRDTMVSADEQKVAGMSDYVLRLFAATPADTANPGFSVYVGYYEYQVQGKSIHSPKNCLPGAGWEALNAGVHTVDVNGVPHPVNRYLLANKGSQALVYYWYQGRGRIEANEYRVKYNLMHDAALYGRTEEALVRIVVPIRADAVRANATAAYAAADSLATGVARGLIPGVANALPTTPAS